MTQSISSPQKLSFTSEIKTLSLRLIHPYIWGGHSRGIRVWWYAVAIDYTLNILELTLLMSSSVLLPNEMLTMKVVSLSAFSVLLAVVMFTSRSFVSTWNSSEILKYDKGILRSGSSVSSVSVSHAVFTSTVFVEDAARFISTSSRSGKASSFVAFLIRRIRVCAARYSLCLPTRLTAGS